jgi:hypothetical protein
VRVPSVVSEARPQSLPEWSIGVLPGTPSAQVDATLVHGLLPSYPQCADGDGTYLGFEAYRPVAMWPELWQWPLQDGGSLLAAAVALARGIAGLAVTAVPRSRPGP